MEQVTKVKFQSAAAAVVEKYPRRPAALATPPPGSGLKPVMGDAGPPVLGHVLSALSDPLAAATDSAHRYGPVWWTGFVGMRVVYVTGPAALEQVWMNKQKAFSSEQGWWPIIGPFFRRGIMLMDGDEHLYHRRILQQAFSPTRLKAYMNIVAPSINRSIDAWTPSNHFEVYTETKKMLLQLASEVFLGASWNDDTDAIEAAFEDCVRGGQAVVRSNVPGGVWSRGLRGRTMLKDYFLAEIPQRRSTDRDDLFSVLCNAETDEGESFSDDDIANQMIFAMMAAHDTSTIAISMLVYHLGKDQRWQQRLREECVALGKEELSYDDIGSLELLDLAFKEALRINAPVGMLFRKAMSDTEIDGYYIPEGTLVAINPYVTMRTSQWWDDPDRFDPERFAGERAEHKSHRFAWSPFGGGAHKCIGLYFGGMLVKVALYHLLRNYEWTVPSDYEPVMTWGTGPTPADGLPITLRPLTRG